MHSGQTLEGTLVGQQFEYTCDDKGEFAGFVYTLEDSYTDEAMEDGEADTDSQSAVATTTYNDLEQIIAQSSPCTNIYLHRKI